MDDDGPGTTASSGWAAAAATTAAPVFNALPAAPSATPASRDTSACTACWGKPAVASVSAEARLAVMR